MNRKAKGSRREREALRILEKQGYNVTKSGASLGLFDLIAINKEHIRLIQVKSNIISSKELANLRQYNNIPLNAIKEVWIKKDYKDWEITVL